MAKSANQKIKLSILSKMFYEETDYDPFSEKFHGITTEQIIKRLAELDIPVERKTVYDDIATLNSLGMNIEKKVKGRTTYYYSASLPYNFELSDLKILVDSVQSAKFISERHSAKLIKKIESLASQNQKDELNHDVHITGRIKSMNGAAIFSVDYINKALNEKKKVTFEYTSWGTDMVLHKKNKQYKVTPLSLIWDNEFYYLIAYDDIDQKIKHYRVDKMRSVEISRESATVNETTEDFDPTRYTKSVFNMFGSREEVNVTLRAPNSLIGVFIDQFGKDFQIVVEEGKDTFLAVVPVKVSDQFFGWVLGLGGAAKIVHPENVVEEYKTLLKKAME